MFAMVRKEILRRKLYFLVDNSSIMVVSNGNVDSLCKKHPHAKSTLLAARGSQYR